MSTLIDMIAGRSVVAGTQIKISDKPDALLNIMVTGLNDMMLLHGHNPFFQAITELNAVLVTWPDLITVPTYIEQK